MRKPVISQPIQLLQTNFLTIKRFGANFGEFQKYYDVVVFGPRAGIVAVKHGKMKSRDATGISMRWNNLRS